MDVVEAAARNPFGLKSKKYGNKFGEGFLPFLHDQELSDVTVVGPDGVEYRLHMLLLAYHSEFFRKAFTSEFREREEKRVTLRLHDPNNVWPILVEFFYSDELTLTDQNVVALYALARELMIDSVQRDCTLFAQSSMDSANALAYLNQAVQFECEHLRESCVKLVAEGFPTTFNKPADGLPVEVILEILSHQDLNAQCEEQVLVFVLNYVKRHRLDEQLIGKLFSQVKFMYLPNDCLSRLATEPQVDIADPGGTLAQVPREVLLEGMAARLSLLDHPEKVSPSHAPRTTYSCCYEYGLPGGSEFVSVPMENVWEELVPQLSVRVSGDFEGDPQSILRTVEDNSLDTAWFTVCGEPSQVWIEIEFPENMRVVELAKYTFSHGMNFASHMFPYGISDSQWFSMKGLVTEVCPLTSADTYHTLKTYAACHAQTEYTINIEPGQTKSVAWRKLRICASDDGEAEFVRLSVRKLKLFGKLQVSLLQKAEDGRDLLAIWQAKREAKQRRSRNI